MKARRKNWRNVFIEEQSFDELQKTLKKVISHYNNKRYHYNIVLKAPLTFTKTQVGHLTVH
jgi:hypothetical protein